MKELELSEGRCTGIPTMREAMADNGSQPPRFETDEERTYFFVELLAHEDLKGFELPAKSGDWDEIELSEKAVSVLVFVNGEPKRKVEIAEHLEVNPRGGTLPRVIGSLLEQELIEFTIPDKPRSRNQKYKITEKGTAFFLKS